MVAPVLELSEDQREALDRTDEWYQDRQSGSEDLTLGGYAGTGKTFTLARVPSHLGLREDEVAFVAPTNKAKKVITRKLRANGIAAEATTIHRLIYISLPIRLSIPNDYPMWPIEREVAVLLSAWPVKWDWDDEGTSPAAMNAPS
jgi:hypothetical protein